MHFQVFTIAASFQVAQTDVYAHNLLADFPLDATVMSETTAGHGNAQSAAERGCHQVCLFHPEIPCGIGNLAFALAFS